MLGIGVTAGQTEKGFALNGWALVFWFGAAAVVCWTWVVPWAAERLRSRGGIEPLDLEPPPPMPVPKSPMPPEPPAASMEPPTPKGPPGILRIVELEIKVKWREEPEGLDIAVFNLSPYKVDGFKFSITNLRWRASNGEFVDVPEFHSGPLAFEEIVFLDGSSQLFCEIPVRYTFVRKEGQALRFQGAVRGGLQQLKIDRQGVWQVSLMCRDAFRELPKVLHFEWTKNSVPRPWKFPEPKWTPPPPPPYRPVGGN